MTTIAQLQEIADKKPSEQLDAIVATLSDAIIQFALCPSTDSLQTVIGLWTRATHIAGL